MSFTTDSVRVLSLAICSISLGWIAPTPAGAAEIFQPAVWPTALSRPLSSSARAVTIDLVTLEAAEAGDRIDLDPVPGGGLVETVIETVTRRSPTSYSLLGRFEAERDGFVLLAIEGDAVAGVIQLPASYAGAPDGTTSYVVQYVGEGVHELSPAQPIEIADCTTPDGTDEDGENDEVPQWRSPLERTPLAGSCPAPSPHGDVMIYYTPAARAEAGGTSAMDAQCQLAVDTANLTYVDSQISNRLRLVFRGEIAYTESGSSETDRNRLKNTSDGFMDQVHTDRNVYGGDFVCLFLKNADADECGIAYCTPSGPSEGFCTVTWGCASSNFSFAHEIGHLQGCAHNRGDAGFGCNEFCYSYGYRFVGDSGTRWRTVMSYDTDPASYTRIGRWSSPNVTFDGQPCGNWTGICTSSSAFNAATVEGTAYDREAWRDSRFDVWVDRFGTGTPRGTYQEPFRTVASGVAAVFSGGPTPAQPLLRIKSSSYAEAIVISKALRMEACGGSVVIGN